MSFRTKPLQMSLARATDGQAVLRTEFGLSNSTFPTFSGVNSIRQGHSPGVGAG